MFVRTLLGLAALAATTDPAFAQETPNALPPTLIAADLAVEPACCKPSPAYTYRDPIGTPGRFWASGEWLYWATSGQLLPVIATASPVGTAIGLAGILGSPNTAVLIGGDRANKDFRNGYRLNAGWWCDDCRTWGIEGDFFFLQDSRYRFAAGSNDSPIIARPIVNPLTGLPDAQLVSFPGLVGGAITADVRNSTIGGGVNAIRNLCGNACSRLDFLIGYRYWNVADEVTVSENVTILAGQNFAPTGTQFSFSNRYATSNNFHGGLIGLSGEKQRSYYFVSARTTVALGANCQIVDIGSTPGDVFLHNTRSVFAVVPEVGVRAGVQCTKNARAFAGYNFLYISNVVRGGDQIAAPGLEPKTTDFWAQGVSLGLELRY